MMCRALDRWFAEGVISLMSALYWKLLALYRIDRINSKVFWKERVRQKEEFIALILQVGCKGGGSMKRPSDA